MDGARFDAMARGLARRGSRRRVLGTVAGAVAAIGSRGSGLAQGTKGQGRPCRATVQCGTTVYDEPLICDWNHVRSATWIGPPLQ